MPGKLPEWSSSRDSQDGILYQPEPISTSQSNFLERIFGPVGIYSGLGSAETGFWGEHNPDMTGQNNNHPDSIDDIYDTRSMLVEILPTEDPLATTDNKEEEANSDAVGLITVTSLQRLRNPLVRYKCGDLVSIHPIPAAARSRIPPGEVDNYRVIRMYGRDPRFTFAWNGQSFQYTSLSQLTQKPGWNILQWQIIIRPSPEGECLTVQLLRDSDADGGISDSEVATALKAVFLEPDSPLFCLIFLEDLEGFERSTTEQKVIRFVDLRNQTADE